MARLTPYLLVGVGGFIGAIARFVVSRVTGGAFDTRFPLATFLINVSGSFLLGVLGAVIAERVTPGSESLRLALGVGFLGAFTTFSTFEFETSALIESGSWLLAAVNVTASVIVGFVALRAGLGLGRMWLQ